MRYCLVAVLLLGLTVMAAAQMAPGGPPAPGGPAPAMGPGPMGPGPMAAPPAGAGPVGAALAGAVKAEAAGAEAADKPPDAPSTSIVVSGPAGGYPAMRGSHVTNRTAPYDEWPDPARVRGRHSAMSAEIWIIGSKRRSSPDNKLPSHILVAYLTHRGHEIAVTQKSQ